MPRRFASRSFCGRFSNATSGRAAQTAKTNGSPVSSFQAAPKSSWCG